MIFHNRQGFWHRRGIESLEESKGENEGLQRLRRDEVASNAGQRDERRTSLEAQASPPPRPAVRDTPPSEEEGRQ